MPYDKKKKKISLRKKNVYTSIKIKKCTRTIFYTVFDRFQHRRKYSNNNILKYNNNSNKIVIQYSLLLL